MTRVSPHSPKTTTCSSGSEQSTAAQARCTRASSTKYLSNLARDIQMSHRRCNPRLFPPRPSTLTPSLQCKFTTRVFHPNVDAQSGSICLDILTADKWSAVLDVRILQLTTLQHSAASPSAGQGAACLVAVAAFRAQQRITVEQSSRLTVMI